MGHKQQQQGNGNKGTVLALAREVRGQKSTKKVVLAACACTLCGQRSNARANTGHFSCPGVKLGSPAHQTFVALRGRLTFPNKGVWEPVA